MFCCLSAAEHGGATPIADSRVVYERLDPHLRARFMDRKIRYVRTYGHGVDLPWQTVFQTDHPHVVEAYCRTHEITWEWFDDGTGLSTSQIRPAARCYCPTNERVWFNQAHLFHVSSLAPELRLALCELFAPDRLPRHATYGDGTQSMTTTSNEVRAVYEAVRVPIHWHKGDLLMLDKFLLRARPPAVRRRSPGDRRDGHARRRQHHPAVIMPLTVVGISAYYHESACCLLQDGELVAAAEEERFSRRKHDPAMPASRVPLLPRRGRHRHRATSTAWPTTRRR